MSVSPSHGVLQICVQCALEEHQSSLSAHRLLNDIGAAIAATFCELQLPATWALSNHSIESLSRILTGGPNQQEIALLADSSWCSPESSRRGLVGELCRRLDLFRNQNLSVSTLVLSDTDVGRHIEALPKAGLQVVRRQVDELVNRRKRSTANPRYGVLMVTPSALIPGRPGLLVRWDCAFSAKQSLWKSISQRSAQHVVIDLGKFVALPKSRMRQLERWLRLVARLKDAGRLEIELVKDATGRRYPSGKRSSSHSILRPAA
jgi:hypothetical protein